MSENLRMSSLRESLNNILFSGKKDMLKYIVPLQGNWYNPTTGFDSKNTWVGYCIDNIAYSSAAINRGTEIIRQAKAQIHLTFIGNNAEDMANDTVFWPYRADVVKEFERYDGVLNNKDFRVFTSLYMQEGLANTLCYNINLVVSYNEKKVINSPVLSKADITGEIIVR